MAFIPRVCFFGGVAEAERRDQDRDREPAAGSLEPLLRHLERTTRLERAEARRLVGEVIAYFGESLPEFVARRHRELQAESLRNEAIYRRIAEEAQERRFEVGKLSERQIRRLIYG